MQSISGTGNVASTPIKTVPTTGIYLLQMRNTVFASGGASVTCNGVTLISTPSQKPVPARLTAGDVLQYTVGNASSPWSFDFELYDLSATPEIG